MTHKYSKRELDIITEFGKDTVQLLAEIYTKEPPLQHVTTAMLMTGVFTQYYEKLIENEKEREQ